MTTTDPLPRVAADRLAERLHGRLLRPGDAGYDAARAVFNAMIDRHPAAVVQCRDADDVAAGIRFAREHELTLAVRGGGHSVAGTAVCDGGIVLDLSGWKGLRVDPGHRTARAAPGLTLGELDRGTQEEGLATPLGVMSGTGIAGLTLGGGLGWLNGRYGLSCDNLVGADLVTADGERLRVGPDEHPDLHWAIRGGGGNFGVVTSFEYRLHPVGPVLAGGLTYPAASARDAVRRHQEVVSGAPDELTTSLSFHRDDAGRPTVSIGICWCGPLEDGGRVVAPLRQVGPPVVDTIGATSFVDLQSGPDASFPHGRLHYWKSGYLRELGDEAVDTLLEQSRLTPPGASGLGLQHLHGAAARVPVGATAFPHRADQYDLVVLAQWADPAASAEHVAWATGVFDAMRPHMQRAVYANNLGTEGVDRVLAAYGPNHARLAEVKRVHDPDNVFRMNHNVLPAPAG